MKKSLLLLILMSQFLFPQLKEMEVKPTENRGGIAIFRDYPDKAGIIFYSQYDNLSFYSVFGIHKVMGDSASGKYVVIVEPARQSFEIRCQGHKSEIIKINDLQPRDVLYYEVLPKKDEGIQGVTEIGITVQVKQPDAEITIDGESFPHNKTKKTSTGKHRLKIKKKDYVTYDEDILVSPEMTLFLVELTYDVASTLVKVEGGTFIMGATKEQLPEAHNDEKPAHKVTLSSFLVSKFEVTQELWESVMGSNPSYFKGNRRPVDQVSWYDAVEFCNKFSEKIGLTPAYTINKDKKDLNNNNEYDQLKWLVTCDFTTNGYRLPTDAEWEYLAKGGGESKSKSYEYNGSNDVYADGWFRNNSGHTTHDVGGKQPNELGLYDTRGNVSEWCWDWYGDYSSEGQTNPKGPSFGSYRVRRGGCYVYLASDCRVTNRYYEDPGSGSGGFRLVRTK
jgi:formylglycine-generating enzyme required for sulfatase activity